MRVHRIGTTKKARRMRTRALGGCVFVGLFAIAFAMQSGGRESFAQSATAQDQDEVVPARPFPEQANPAPPNAVLEIQATESSQDGARAPAPSQPAKPEAAAAPTDPQQKQIVDESANLMKLANRLKAEVDKTTPDTLSVAVIRQAGEIEKLAHKMRTR